MNTAAVPAYPVVYVDVSPDGSAHVNVAGRHTLFDAAPSSVTRQAVTAYAATLACELRRPVRMRITDPDGRWLVAVHPDATVTELAEASQKTSRAKRQNAAVASPPAAPEPLAPTTQTSPPELRPPLYRPPLRVDRPLAPASQREPEPATALESDLERTAFANRSRRDRTDSAQPTATLTFSTGEVAHVDGSALIGRRPSAEPGEDVDLTVRVDDDSRKLSRTHLRLEWHDASFWATDRASGNGTIIERAGEPPSELTPWQPLSLHDGDVAVLGDVRITIAFAAPERG